MPNLSLVVSLARQKLPYGKIACLVGIQATVTIIMTIIYSNGYQKICNKKYYPWLQTALVFKL
jgi:hypothetical protein